MQTTAYLSFRIGTEIFAASVTQIHEILELTRITRVPHAPPYMRGVTNLRGTVLPVIDSRAKFGFPETPPTPDTSIVVLDITSDDKNIVLGALVDAVIEVFELSPEALKPLPPFGSKYPAEFVTGMIQKDDGFVMLLDIEKVFTTAELVQLQQSHHEASETQAP
jgi:purine-binding chemotaxis protein CheW